MKLNCDVVRDLLPLYVDDACSEESRHLVEEHLGECAECGEVLRKLRESEVESDLKAERNEVIRYGAKRLRRRSALVGSAVSGLFMIPILVCLVINIVSELTMSWFFVVIASLCVAASLTVVPLMVPRDKLFWTFCAFCVSLMVLLAVTCLYTGGDWFWIASSATLFGLSAVFLPFLIKARPVRELIGNVRRLPVVLAVDGILFLNMMYTISHRGRTSGLRTLLIVVAIAAAGAAAVGFLRKKGILKD